MNNNIKKEWAKINQKMLMASERKDLYSTPSRALSTYHICHYIQILNKIHKDNDGDEGNITVVMLLAKMLASRDAELMKLIRLTNPSNNVNNLTALQEDNLILDTVNEIQKYSNDCGLLDFDDDLARHYICSKNGLNWDDVRKKH